MIECTKTKFATQKQADYFINKLQRTSTRQSVPLRSYLCQHCFSWHLSSSEQRVTTQIQLNNCQAEIKEKNQLIQKLEKTIHELRVKLKQK